MGGQIYIHRAADWFESETAPITEREWERLVMRTDDLLLKDDGTVAWTEHPNEVEVSLRWEEGRIAISDPDRLTRVRLAQLADDLRALLQNDTLDLYRADGEQIEDDAHWTTVPVSRRTDPNRPRTRGDLFRTLFGRE